MRRAKCLAMCEGTETRNSLYYPLFLLQLHPGISCAPHQRQDYSEPVYRCYSQVKEDNRAQNRQDLFDIGLTRIETPCPECQSSKTNSPATVMLTAPNFLLALKLTTLSVNAIMPLMSNSAME